MKRRTKVLTAFLATAGMILVATPSQAAEGDPISVEIVSGYPTITEGFMPPEGSTPTTDPYPAADPVEYVEHVGSSRLFEGIVTPGGERMQFYCVQILEGAGQYYQMVDRATADIGNEGYVARLVNSYYPATDLPVLPPDTRNWISIKASVVQAAIWYFTDGYVVAQSDALYDMVAQAVTDTLEAGPLPEDASPDLSFSLTGPTDAVQAGGLAGPFVADAAIDAATFTVDAGDATVYADAAGTQVIPAGTELSIGEEFWVRSDVAGSVTVTANGSVPWVPGFYLLGDEGEFPLQTLVSANSTPYQVSASATAEFVAAPTPPTPVTPAGPELAATGPADLMPLMGLGVLMLLAGAAATYGRRLRTVAVASRSK